MCELRSSPVHRIPKRALNRLITVPLNRTDMGPASPLELRLLSRYNYM